MIVGLKPGQPPELTHGTQVGIVDLDQQATLQSMVTGQPLMSSAMRTARHPCLPERLLPFKTGAAQERGRHALRQPVRPVLEQGVGKDRAIGSQRPLFGR